MTSSARNFDAVVIVCDKGGYFGGREKVAIDSAVLLAKTGIQVVFFCATGPVEPRLGEAGVRTVCLNLPELNPPRPSLGAVSRNIWNAGVARRFKRLLDDHDPQRTIVHLHSYRQLLTAPLASVATADGRRCVYTMHDYFLFCPNGGFFNYQKERECHLKPMGPACLATHCDRRSYLHKLYRIAQQTVIRTGERLPRNLRNIIYLSRKQKEKVADYLHADTRLFSVPNLIPVARGERVRAEQNRNFISIGRMSEEKGLADLAEASRRGKLPVVCVGDGRIRDRVRAINPDIFITGWVSEERVETWLHQARCLVFPSKWMEGQPLVVLQALARGVPVICYDASCAVDCVTDGVDGDIVPVSEGVEGLLQAMRKYAAPELVEARSRNAYKKYWANPLTPERHLERLLQVYQSVSPSGAKIRVREATETEENPRGNRQPA